MEAVLPRAQHARANHRHDLRTLTYVILDEANGGVIRNLSHQGVAVQAVAALRAHQLVRLRFELRHPRLRVEARGEVVWSNASGQCGIRFVDLPARMIRQINEWIFGNLLETIPQHGGRVGSIFGSSMGIAGEVDDGLIVSQAPLKVIQMETRAESPGGRESMDWLSQPLSERGLAWMVDSLILIAAFLLFSLMFLAVTRELPRWPLSLEVGLGAAVFIPSFYCAFFYAFGGASLGARLARLVGSGEKDGEEARDGARFR
jgi:PilZ domain-containing protein